MSLGIESGLWPAESNAFGQTVLRSLAGPSAAPISGAPLNASFFARPDAAAQVALWLERVTRGSAYPLVDPIVTGPANKTRRSVVFRCVESGNRPALAIKFCIDPAKKRLATKDARRQYAALEHVAKAANGDGVVRAPKPIMLLEEQACIVMEWIDGASVADILMRTATPKADLLRWARRAGGWLSAFHSLSPKAPRPADTPLMLSRLDQAIDKNGAQMESLVFHDAVRELRRTAPGVGAILLPTAWRHGDFKAQNLLISGDAFCAIDLDVQDEDVIAADVAKFITDLEFLSWYPQAWRLRRNREGIIEQFLAGYLPDMDAGLRLPVVWFRLYGVLRHWLDFEATGGFSPQDIYERHCFKSRTRALGAELGRLHDSQ